MFPRGKKSKQQPPVGNVSQANAKRILYTSFANTKGGRISEAPRLLWNDTTCPIPPSRCCPLAPPPTAYTPVHPDAYRGVPIPRSKRIGIAVPSLTTPGPGYYSSSDLNSPFTTFGDAPTGCQSVPPKKPTWTISKCPSPRPFPIDIHGPPFGELDSRTSNRSSRNSRSPTKLKAQLTCGSPHPQFYRPNFKAVQEDHKLGALTLKSPRFPIRSIAQSPGPGEYGSPDRPVSNAFRQVKLYRRNRKLEHLVADHRNLLTESKLPGPGSYDPLLLHNGKDSRPFEHPATRSYYVLCSTANSVTSNASFGDMEDFSNMHHYGVTVS